jgi:ADP-dependent NAD(P)H-hydrate dehydratase / NAD(P)H-hydrate epimerase
MQKADAIMTAELGVSVEVLMEAAGEKTVEILKETYGDLRQKSFLVLCGKGHNGGDGFVIARLLVKMGAGVKVVICCQQKQIRAQVTKKNLEKLQALSETNKIFGLQIIYYTKQNDFVIDQTYDFVIDAIFGTGLQKELGEPFVSLISYLNTELKNAQVIAIDLPSGLNSDTGKIMGTGLKANLTVTMAAQKVGLLINNGPGLAGKVKIADIGISKTIIESLVDKELGLYAAEIGDIKSWLPRRLGQANKYSVGLATVVAGSNGFSGAAYMASMAAAHIGAGAVVCACPQDIQNVLMQKFTEVMTLGLPISNPEACLKILKNTLEKTKALLIGPGMGKEEYIQALIRNLACQNNLQTVLDAGGLNAFKGYTNLITEHANGRWTLTPHWGEFERLTGIEAEVSFEDRPNLIRKYAKEWNCILILKGFPALVALPDGKVFMNQTGNAALATAGTGDVLAGMCVGLMAQGLAPDRAALTALYLGGACADRYVLNKHQNTMLATDLLNELPFVMADLSYLE